MSTSCPQAATSKEIVCSKCAVIDTPAVEHGRWGPHRIKATCRHCGAFVRWISERSLEERKACTERFRREATAKKPVTLDQLGKLESLHWEGPLPKNRQAAIDLIDGLVRRRGGAA